MPNPYFERTEKTERPRFRGDNCLDCTLFNQNFHPRFESRDRMDKDRAAKALARSKKAMRASVELYQIAKVQAAAADFVPAPQWW